MKPFCKITAGVVFLAVCICFQPFILADDSSSDTAEFEKLTASAESGDAQSQYLLGRRFFDGADDAGKDYLRAVEWFRKAAENGHAGAQSYIGYIYMTVVGISSNAEDGLKWLRLAAETNDVSAQYYLGTFYEMGRGVEPDRFEAMDWYMKAAAQGDRESKTCLSRLRRTADEARHGIVSNEWWTIPLEELIRQAEEGNAEAQDRLGNRYKGYGGTGIDVEKAKYWFEKAAVQTNLSARYNLSRLYVSTTNVVPDQAFYHCAIAAEGGYRRAQRTLGEYYRDGFGTKPDRETALHWFSLAEQAGDDRAGSSILSLIKGRAKFTEDYKGQVASEDYSPPAVELVIHDRDNQEQTVKFLGYNPKTKQVETDYPFGASTMLPLSAFDTQSHAIIQNALRHQALEDDLSLEIKEATLSREECETFGHIYGKRGASRYKYDGVMYRVKIENNDNVVALQNLDVESRCFYEVEKKWQGGGLIPDSKVKLREYGLIQKYQQESFKLQQIGSCEKRELRVSPFIVESYETEPHIYFTDDSPTSVKSSILGIWVRVSCSMADGSTIYRDFCEPSSLKSKVTWK